MKKKGNEMQIVNELKSAIHRMVDDISDKGIYIHQIFEVEREIECLN